MDRESIYLLALAVRSAVFQSLMNAYNDQDNADRWFKQADKLEGKFKTDYGHNPYAWIEMYEQHKSEL